MQRPEVIFVGTGEACDPELPNASLLFCGAKNVLVDCGYGVPHALWRITRDAQAIDALVLTHIHGDHSFGLPGLLLWMREAGRTRPLTLVGGSGTRAAVRSVVNLAYPGLFDDLPYACDELVVNPGAPVIWNELEFATAQSQHSVRNLAVRITDGGASVCVSGDGAPTEATRALYGGSDLLVHECYGHLEAGKNHAALGDVLALAPSVGRLCLWHLSVRDKAAIVEAVDESILVPKPGDRLALPPKRPL